MLSKHKLYPNTGGSLLPSTKIKNNIDKILWILFKTNGKKTINEISKELKIKHIDVENLISVLQEKKIIKHI